MHLGNFPIVIVIFDDIAISDLPIVPVRVGRLRPPYLQVFLFIWLLKHWVREDSDRVRDRCHILAILFSVSGLNKLQIIVIFVLLRETTDGVLEDHIGGLVQIVDELGGNCLEEKDVKEVVPGEILG